MILITGTAGFIGFHLAERLVQAGEQVLGLDVINDYYSVRMKYARLREAGINESEIEYGEIVQSHKHPNYRFIQLDIADRDRMNALFAAEKFASVINLAAQAGVRYSLVNPQPYVNSNIVGFINVLEACRHHGVEHLIYASSSSVYGLNRKMPLSTSDNVDHPISLYAASKKSNELMAHTYSHLFGLATTGLRFFTVYGPWGRPDMAFFLFTEAIIKGEPIKVFNHGNSIRDFTYIDDIVEGIVRAMGSPPAGDPEWNKSDPNPSTAPGPYRLYNLGNNQPVKLSDFIREIEDQLNLKAVKEYADIQPGDVAATYADVGTTIRELGYQPKTSLREGISQFIHWYREYYGL
ncbi:NAD-dependent epimerase [Lewinella sp. JB7]|uniref:NAD-dependent epimerase n=1 Tax=Lewinella sp. JB7 TaxID=2962887 RepID=UPI0020C98F2C|nr:NAD-dependent epimerase [Lewinella sp. JB7]MCP9236792.1 NAD-dependent epimerase [Lewinella sp. JB7]